MGTEIFFLAVLLLAGFAVLDLVVGVSNDAINFLNSSIGSRVAPRYVILLVAVLGILVGVTFSGGMMEVARKGIFHPELFTMPELITIFLAVMITDVILLDLFNTFGLPTSTTVSIVFELLGAAVAVSMLKLMHAGADLATLGQYINTSKALAIIAGILLSIVVAFVFGSLTQLATRLIFTFDYAKRLNRYGAVWGGVALSSITYFILVKGAKGATFITHRAGPVDIVQRGRYFVGYFRCIRRDSANFAPVANQYSQAYRADRHLCAGDGLCRQRSGELHRCAHGRLQRIRSSHAV